MRKSVLLGGILVGAGLIRLTQSRRKRLEKGLETSTLPRISVPETISFIMDVALPNFAKGVIKRRKPVVGLGEATNLEKRAVRRMQKLDEKYGPGPAMLKLPVRNQAVILRAAHVQKVLENSPEPFATASSEKQAALGHFQPHGVLISHGAARAERRRLNEQVLESECPIHSLGGRFQEIVKEEADDLLGALGPAGEFGWEEFSQAWFRIVRRVVLGDSARDDRDFHALLTKLRYDANWAFLKPRNHELRRTFLGRLRAYLDRAEPGSLASVMASIPKDASSEPEHQVPQWLFAFDPAGMATCRALALLAAHPEQMIRARAEIEGAAGKRNRLLPFLRAIILESLRLWPTTPLILRQTTRETRWDAGSMPAGTGIAIFAPYFHRDDRHLPFANRFAPDIWLKDPPAGGWPMVPFSGGPGICPGKHLVLLIGTAFLAEMLNGREIRLSDPQRLNRAELPAPFDHYSMRYQLRPIGTAEESVILHRQIPPDRALAPTPSPGYGSRILTGALAGIIASFPMTVAMQRLHGRLPTNEQYALTPREIIDSAMQPANEPAKDVALAAHFGYGAATGALLALARPRIKGSAGAASGAAIWLASYMGWIPALRILKPATRHPARRNLVMIGVHLLWGWATAVAVRELILARETIFAGGEDKDVPADVREGQA